MAALLLGSVALSTVETGAAKAGSREAGAGEAGAGVGETREETREEVVAELGDDESETGGLGEFKGDGFFSERPSPEPVVVTAAGETTAAPP